MAIEPKTTREHIVSLYGHIKGVKKDIHHIVYKLWDVSVLRAAEITFILCIPVAYWMASKINERWHDDRED